MLTTSISSFCPRSLCGGRLTWNWWSNGWKRTRWWPPEGDQRCSVEFSSGPEWLELSQVGLPDYRVRDSGGAAAYGRKEPGQTTVEQPDGLRQLGHLQHGPEEQHWTLQGKRHYTISDLCLNLRLPSEDETGLGLKAPLMYPGGCLSFWRISGSFGFHFQSRVC